MANGIDISNWTKQLVSPIYDGIYPTSSRPTAGGGFQLPAGNFMPARMPLNRIYPQDDATSSTYARHRFAHSVMSYRIPIGVQGGAYPFKYEIVTAPTGSSIGETHGSTDYGVLTTPAGGAGAYTIRVTDQDGSIIDLSWSSALNDSKFTFIQDGYAGTKTGSITQPLEDFADYYKGSDADSTHAGQILVFRGGNYAAIGDAVTSNNNISINGDVKSPSMIGFPTESPIVDCTNAKFFTRGGTIQKDMFIAGMRFANSRQDVTNAHFFWCTFQIDRMSFHEVYFINHGSGTVGNDNTCAIFASARNGMKNHVLIKHCTFDDFHNNSSNGSYSDMYDTSDILIEENTALNSTSSYGWWCKGTTANVSIRANVAITNNAGRQATIGYGSESALLPHDHEICWNQFALNTDAVNITTWATSNAYGGQTYNSYIYRNTFYRGIANIRFSGAENFETDSNVVINNSNPVWDTTLMTTVFANVTGTVANNITDSSGVLIGQSRIDYLGTKGHEVSS